MRASVVARHRCGEVKISDNYHTKTCPAVGVSSVIISPDVGVSSVISPRDLISE